MKLKPIDKVIAKVGGPSALARALRIKPPTVIQWISGDRPIPGKRCIQIELACGGAVTRYELRPDIFGPTPKRAA